MLLSAQNVSYAHRDFRILNELNVSVNSGELLIIVGPNGAGKSTLLNLLANEITKESDAVFFKSKKYKDWSPQVLAYEKAKFSQQYSPDIPLKTKDIVLMGRYPYFDSVPKISDWDAVKKSMQQMEVGHLSERNYNTLSGGEKQRVHLSRVLAQLDNEHHQKLAFFDEPLNNLDIRHQYNIMEAIKNFTQQGNAALLVLHDLNLAAQFADKVLLLQSGAVVAYGKPTEVFQETTIQAAYQFPCMVMEHPITKMPLIVFNTAEV